jgi:hypothetical protein
MESGGGADSLSGPDGLAGTYPRRAVPRSVLRRVPVLQLPEQVRAQQVPERPEPVPEEQAVQVQARAVVQPVPRRREVQAAVLPVQAQRPVVRQERQLESSRRYPPRTRSRPCRRRCCEEAGEGNHEPIEPGSPFLATVSCRRLAHAPGSGSRSPPLPETAA